MDVGSAADWAAALATWATGGIAAAAAYLGIKTFQHQRTSSDVQLALSIFEAINRYWDRLTDTSSENYIYDMGQILAHFEIAALLFNRSVLTRDALPILKDHIIEVFSYIKTSPDGEKLLGVCNSSSETFSELKLFLKVHMPTALNAVAFQEALSTNADAQSQSQSLK